MGLSAKVQLTERGVRDLNKYRRIEVKTFRQRVNIVCGERPRDVMDSSVVQTADGVAVSDSDLCEVEPDSPEGQQILIEAMRSLERRLSPQARAIIRNSSQDAQAIPEGFKPVTEKGPRS